MRPFHHRRILHDGLRSVARASAPTPSAVRKSSSVDPAAAARRILTPSRRALTAGRAVVDSLKDGCIACVRRQLTMLTRFGDDEDGRRANRGRAKRRAREAAESSRGRTAPPTARTH